jgi:CheY-like chemotaxis protein
VALNNIAMKNNILLVEDNDEIRENIAELLTLEGYKVLKANCGGTAIKIAEEQIPNLVICETIMREIDGYSVYLALFTNLYTHHIPFIYFTAKFEHGDEQELKFLSVENFPFRRFHDNGLVNCVKKIMPLVFNQLNSSISMSSIGIN